MKRILLPAIGLFAIAANIPAATFVTKVTQASGQNWTAAIWSNPPNTTLTAPAAGNSYESVDNGTAFGASATGGSVNNTRLRNPASAGVQTFPGDSLTLSANSELRAKTAGAVLNFPGVGGNPGLILNGGALNAGDDTVFAFTGKIQVTAPSLICPADQGAGAILQPRGFNFQAALSGSGSLIVCQAGLTVAQEVSSSFNSFTGEWIVKAGWLKGSGNGSLGDGNITIDPLASVPITTASTLSNGPAQLEIMYDITSPGRLTLRNGGKMILHQNCSFAAAAIEGTDLTTGKHSYAELAAAYPNNFASGGSGSITVGRIITVNTVNNETPGAGETSLLQALSGLQEGDIVRFNIAGSGPHVIVTPLGGYPLITANGVTINGYTQPGSSPNTNPILGGNNAQIKIVLDSTGTDTAPNPGNPELPLSRSTRLDLPAYVGNTGFGTSENAMLGVFEADNVTIRGLSFIARRTSVDVDANPAIYSVALIHEATNARVQGCWFGLAPGAGTTTADVKPPAAAVAAYRWRIGGDVYSAGAIIGTDGDGVNDRAEFNVMVGCRDAMALELPGARISGNYVNVFPDGLHFVDLDANYQLWKEVFEADGADLGDLTTENYENGRVTEGSVIGTNGDGVSDSDERNVFGHTVYGTHGEFYSSSLNAVLAGNYFGVGVDGVTPAPLSTNAAPDFVEFGGGSGQVRIGSNGDGISDDIEGNLIVNVPGSDFVVSGSSIPIVSRRNKLVNCGFAAVPFADGENSAYAAALADPSAGAVPVLRKLSGGILSGTIPAAGAGYPNVEFDLYKVDPVALANTNFWPLPMTHPMTFLGTYTDNGPGDSNPNANEFSIDVSSFGLSDTTYVAVAANYSAIPALFNATNAVTSPMSNPISARPTLSISLEPLVNATLSWLAPDGAFRLEFSNDLNDPGGWFPLGTGTYTGGRNTVLNAHDPFSPGVFFRLINVP
jgi:hypothetical protein